MLIVFLRRRNVLGKKKC